MLCFVLAKFFIMLYTGEFSMHYYVIFCKLGHTYHSLLIVLIEMIVVVCYKHIQALCYISLYHDSQFHSLAVSLI